MPEPKWLTYRQAARRVKRSERSISRWKHDGMATSTDSRGRVVVEERVLLAYLRARLKAWPIPQQRMRIAARAEAAERSQNPASTPHIG